jgi:hypothetical protein
VRRRLPSQVLPGQLPVPRIYDICARATIVPGQVSRLGSCDDTFARAIARVVVHSSHAVNLPGQILGIRDRVKSCPGTFPRDHDSIVLHLSTIIDHSLTSYEASVQYTTQSVG